MASTPQTPVEPSDEVYRVYGNVMHTVQYWELVLAFMWWWTTTPKSEGREAESKEARRAVDRLEKAFTKVTASQARKELEDDLPSEIRDAVRGLLDDRNRLAHRFLRDRQDGKGFKPGTLGLLGDVGQRFDVSIQALWAHLAAFEPYRGQVRPHWPLFAEALSADLFAGVPVDFDKALSEAQSRIDQD